MDTPGEDFDDASRDARSVPTPSAPPVAAWYADPARRHQFRYWDGTAWTGHVATNGVTTWDPPYTAVPPGPASTAPSVAPPGVGAPATAAVPSGSLRRTGGLATALGWLLGIAGGALVARIGAAVFRIAQVRTAQSWDESKDPAPIIRRLQDADNYLAATLTIAALLAVAILVVLVIWMYRSARNAVDLGRWDNNLGPGWTIGGWFVPIVNWFAPATLAQSLWRGAEAVPPVRGAPRRRSVALGLWWACSLAGGIAFSGGASVPDIDTVRTAQDLYSADSLTIAACVLLAISALLLRGSVLAIQQRMRRITTDTV
ncbi:MAG: DUF4328 domain-containing protein [Actinomycetes bacterium]